MPSLMVVRRKTSKQIVFGDDKNTIYVNDGLYEERCNGEMLHYIATPAGLSALVVTHKIDPSIKDIYYLYHDHLGSLIAATQRGSSVLEEFSYDSWGRRRNPNDWNDYNVTQHPLFTRGFTGHEHIGAFSLINMNGRMYDARLGRFLSPDPYVQAPDYSQSYNRYSYVWNNPLKYTDPNGEFIVTAIIVGAIVGAYIGGSAAEGWQMNPTKWKWDKNTWGGIGMGAIFGGAAGVGFFYAAPALANTAFFAHFGTSGTVAAYTITGGAAGGLAGYGAGFSGGMMYSKGDWKYSHQSGITGAQVGAAMGTAVGAIAGMIQGYEVPKPPPLPRMPQREITLNANQGAFYGTPLPELSAALFLDADFMGYYHGAKVYEHRIFSGGAGICLPPFGIGVGPGVYGSGRYYDRTLLAHEYGHWLQYYGHGPYFYYGVIAPASLSFATNGNRYGWTEIDANRRAFDFFGSPSWWQHFYFPLNKP